MDQSPGEVTRLLNEVRLGNESAKSALVALVYPELRQIARARMRRERPDHTLQATALVNEVCLRLGHLDLDWQSKSHFLGVAAQLMRQVLIDYARRHRSAKRGGGMLRVEVGTVELSNCENWDNLLALDEALFRLKSWDERCARVVELRFFGGLSDEEIAEVLGVSTRTVKRAWSIARAWLHRELSE
jgi:RNA polymerase sigma factor (TIGR02999 family)